MNISNIHEWNVIVLGKTSHQQNSTHTHNTVGGACLPFSHENTSSYFPLNPGCSIGILIMVCYNPYMGVSKNRGPPKWMVYNGSKTVLK